jgi:hypothetical protein
MKMGDEEIGVAKLDAEGIEPEEHGFPALLPAHPAIHDQMPLSSFNDIRVERLQRISGKRYFNPVNASRHLFRHHVPTLSPF